MTGVLEITDVNFDLEVFATDELTLVYFWAPWCGVCRLVQPILVKFEGECQGSLRLFGVNADENFRLANSYRLQNLPTLMLFHEGKLIQRLEGFHSREELQRNLERMIEHCLLQSVAS